MSVTCNNQDYETKLKKLAEDFERDGFAVYKNFFTEEEVEDIRAECLRLIREDAAKDGHKELFQFEEHQTWGPYIIESSDKLRFLYETNSYDREAKRYLVPIEQSVAKLAHGIHVENDVFKRVIVSKKVEDIYKSINYVNPTVCQSMVIFKNPKVGGEYTPHQDASFLCTEPTINLSGLWIALDDATKENGTLEFIPGSHKGPLKRRFYRSKPDVKSGEDFAWTAPPQEYDQNDFTPVEVKKGDAVILDGLVIHRSGPNNSDKSRWTYTFHIFDAGRSKWCPDNWNQPENKEAYLEVFAN